MKTNKKRMVLLLITSVIIVMAICYALTYIPHKIVNIAPSKVSTIKIFDGGTGKSITITDSEKIEHIIGNLNGIKFKKGKMSLGYKGYSFKTTIYSDSGAVYKELIINSTGNIRKDPFFITIAQKALTIIISQT